MNNIDKSNSNGTYKQKQMADYATINNLCQYQSIPTFTCKDSLFQLLLACYVCK